MADHQHTDRNDTWEVQSNASAKPVREMNRMIGFRWTEILDGMGRVVILGIHNPFDKQICSIAFDVDSDPGRSRTSIGAYILPGLTQKVPMPNIPTNSLIRITGVRFVDGTFEGQI